MESSRRIDVSRRSFLVGAAAAAASAALGAGTAQARGSRPVALVYRGPASSYWCPESVANLLRSGPIDFTVKYVGPGESTQLTAGSLRDAALYAQPGGGSVAASWPHLMAQAPAMREFVSRGGVYLGFCLGAYLAAPGMGFGVFDGSATRYAKTPGSDVQTYGGALVDVSWRGSDRMMYFQDGPKFAPASMRGVTVLGRYRTGAIAAMVSRYGRGSVGLVGPHAEADRSWYAAGMHDPDGLDADLGHDLIATAWNARR